ncbi:MAG: transcriptional repressor [Clostridia bacterium]|nr:transcriptional repressor [Clostridia bacterium]
MIIQRQTKQKHIILDALTRLNHPTATAVYECVHGEHPTVSRATVFRVLKQADENGSIMRLSFAGGEDRFDYNPTPHYHVRCSCCGRVDDVKMPYLSGLEERVEDASGYALQSHDVEFKGLCPNCCNG